MTREHVISMLRKHEKMLWADFRKLNKSVVVRKEFDLNSELVAEIPKGTRIEILEIQKQQYITEMGIQQAQELFEAKTNFGWISLGKRSETVVSPSLMEIRGVWPWSCCDKLATPVKPQHIPRIFETTNIDFTNLQTLAEPISDWNRGVFETLVPFFDDAAYDIMGFLPIHFCNDLYRIFDKFPMQLIKSGTAILGRGFTSCECDSDEDSWNDIRDTISEVHIVGKQIEKYMILHLYEVGTLDHVQTIFMEEPLDVSDSVKAKVWTRQQSPFYCDKTYTFKKCTWEEKFAFYGPGCAHLYQNRLQNGVVQNMVELWEKRMDSLHVSERFDPTFIKSNSFSSIFHDVDEISEDVDLSPYLIFSDFTNLRPPPAAREALKSLVHKRLNQRFREARENKPYEYFWLRDFSNDLERQEAAILWHSYDENRSKASKARRQNQQKHHNSLDLRKTPQWSPPSADLIEISDDFQLRRGGKTWRKKGRLTRKEKRKQKRRSTKQKLKRERDLKKKRRQRAQKYDREAKYLKMDRTSLLFKRDPYFIPCCCYYCLFGRSPSDLDGRDRWRLSTDQSQPDVDEDPEYAKVQKFEKVEFSNKKMRKSGRGSKKENTGFKKKFSEKAKKLRSKEKKKAQKRRGFSQKANAKRFVGVLARENSMRIG